MKNIDSQKLKGLVGLSESDVKGTLAKGVAYMTVPSPCNIGTA